jgi:sorbitol-specific phosphotransferase system component IIC
MSSLAIYLVGMAVLIGGLAYGAHLAGLATQWIAVGAVVLLGIGIVTAVSRTRSKDPPVDSGS